jgi:hypothetical protein
MAVGGAAGAVRVSSSAPLGRYLLQTRGMFAEFEDPSQAYGWHSGHLLDAIADASVQRNVAQQLAHMRAMGVNEIVYEIRSGDGGQPTPFPDCKLSTWLGPLWPQPTAVELAGLATVFQLARQHGMRVMLFLNSTHMEEQPPANAERWLGAILNAVKNDPALDLVAFGGDRRVVDGQPPFDGVPDSCGGQAEAPLWLGPNSLEARYVQWAIGYAMSLGVPPQKLTAEAIVGDYRHEVEQPAGTTAEDRHLWRTVDVMRTIFDRLAVSEVQRTYALSAYSHAKCAFSSFGECSDEDQFKWYDETLRVSRARVGPAARMTLVEWGTSRDDAAIPRTVEHLGVLMQQLGIEGGIYSKWADSAAIDQGFAYPAAALVKVRGPGYVYQPVQKELADLYGFHLTAIPNGSFEDGTKSWTIEGRGTAKPTPLDETDMPWRGASFLRLTTTRTLTATGPRIRASASTSYTTTANLRFSWSGERKPKAKAAKRPQVDVSFRFLTCKKQPSRVRREDIRRFFQENSTQSFQTFPLVFTTPKDACYVQIQLTVARNDLPSGITLDADNFR